MNLPSCLVLLIPVPAKYLKRTKDQGHGKPDCGSVTVKPQPTQASLDATLSAAQSTESNRLLLSSLHFAFLQSAFPSDCANCPARGELGFLELDLFADPTENLSFH